MRISRSIPIAATALLAVGLTGCSGDDGSSGSSGTTTPTTETAASSDIGESTPMADHGYLDGASTITGTMGDGAMNNVFGADVSIDLSDVAVSGDQLCGTVTTTLASLPDVLDGESEADVDEYFSNHENFGNTIGWVRPILDVHLIRDGQVSTRYYSTLGTYNTDATYDPQARTITQQLCGEVPEGDEVVLTLTSTGFEADHEGWMIKL